MTFRSVNGSGSHAVWGLAALGVLGLLVSGCAQQETVAGFVNYQQLDELYDQEAANFPWDLPEGVAFPETIPIADVENTNYESTNARAQAFFYWECAWMEVFFESRNSDPEAAAAALDSIKQSVGNPYKDPFYEDPEGVWAQIVDDAALGAVGEFKTFYETGCSAF